MKEWFFDVKEQNGEVLVAFVQKDYWNQHNSLSKEPVSEYLSSMLPPNLSIDVFDEIKPGVFVSYIDEHQTREGLKLAGFIEHNLLT